MAVFNGAAAGDGGGGFRLWPPFSITALRLKLMDAIACGASRRRRRRPRHKGSALPALRHHDHLRFDAPSDPNSHAAAEAESRRKIEAFEALQLVMAQLQSAASGDDNAGHDRRLEAAAEVRRLSKDDAAAREMLAMLGAIPPLVAALDNVMDSELHVNALYALLNLGIGNDMNKAAIVEAGAVHKMLSLLESKNSQAVGDAIVANFLGLSALDSNKTIIGAATGAIPFLLSAFKSAAAAAAAAASTAREDALRALFNLSINAANVARLVDAGVVADLLTAIGDDMSVSERALATLSNMAATTEGWRAVSWAPDALPILVDVLSWSDAPNCQEKAAYILMVLGHKSPGDRTAMADAGVVSALLELMLVGSPIAQKRASRLLEIINADKGKSVSDWSNILAVSAPLYRAVVQPEMAGPSNEGMCEGKRAVKELVQQSLQSNMRRIARRANLQQEFAPSERLKALTAASSSSKSLPF